MAIIVKYILIVTLGIILFSITFRIITPLQFEFIISKRVVILIISAFYIITNPKIHPVTNFIN